MTSVLLPFLVPMLLGRTIDLRYYNFGGSIYDYENYEETKVGSLNTKYYVLQNDSFPYSQFGLPVDIVLRVKSDYLSSSSGAMGLTGLLKDTSWKYNSVVVAAVTVYKTVDRSLQENATVVSGWKDRIPSTQTHYADRIEYGAWCAVLFRIKCDIPGDVREVRNTVTKILGESGQFSKDTVDLWQKALAEIDANEEIRGQVKVTSSVYSTVQLKTFITDPASYFKQLEDFTGLVKLPGQALYMNLQPIHDLDADYEEVKENRVSIRDLEKIDEMFDDLKVTKENIVRWTTDTTVLFSDEDEARIYTLLEKINSGIRTFRKLVEDVSLYKKMDQGAIDLAFHQYISGLNKGLGTYNLAYMKLREEIDAECESSFLHKIRGLLKVYNDEVIEKGKVEGGLEECQKYCVEDERCRAIGFASHVSKMDLSTGLFIREENQCWIYYRSTNTAIVHTPTEFTGEMGIYDRKCYV